MKITHNKVGQNLNLTDSGKVDKNEKAGAKGKSPVLEKALEADVSSKVNLSSRAQDIKKAKEIAKAAPDIREEKVARLQQMIDAGTYKVAGKDIANKMVDEEAQWMSLES